MVNRGSMINNNKSTGMLLDVNTTAYIHACTYYSREIQSNVDEIKDLQNR